MRATALPSPAFARAARCADVRSTAGTRRASRAVVACVQMHAMHMHPKHMCTDPADGMD